MKPAIQRLYGEANGAIALSELAMRSFYNVLVLVEQSLHQIQRGRVKFDVNCGRRRGLRANFELSLARHC